jgi:hypothetical protein
MHFPEKNPNELAFELLNQLALGADENIYSAVNETLPLTIIL